MKTSVTPYRRYNSFLRTRKKTEHYSFDRMTLPDIVDRMIDLLERLAIYPAPATVILNNSF